MSSKHGKSRKTANQDVRRFIDDEARDSRARHDYYDDNDPDPDADLYDEDGDHNDDDLQEREYDEQDAEDAEEDSPMDIDDPDEVNVRNHGDPEPNRHSSKTLSTGPSSSRGVSAHPLRSSNAPSSSARPMAPSTSTATVKRRDPSAKERAAEEKARRSERFEPRSTSSGLIPRPDHILKAGQIQDLLEFGPKRWMNLITVCKYQIARHGILPSQTWSQALGENPGRCRLAVKAIVAGYPIFKDYHKYWPLTMYLIELQGRTCANWTKALKEEALELGQDTINDPVIDDHAVSAPATTSSAAPSSDPPRAKKSTRQPAPPSSDDFDDEPAPPPRQKSKPAVKPKPASRPPTIEIDDGTDSEAQPKAKSNPNPNPNPKPKPKPKPRPTSGQAPQPVQALVQRPKATVPNPSEQSRRSPPRRALSYIDDDDEVADHVSPPPPPPSHSSLPTIDRTTRMPFSTLQPSVARQTQPKVPTTRHDKGQGKGNTDSDEGSEGGDPDERMPPPPPPKKQKTNAIPSSGPSASQPTGAMRRVPVQAAASSSRTQPVEITRKSTTSTAKPASKQTCAIPPTSKKRKLRVETESEEEEEESNPVHTRSNRQVKATAKFAGAMASLRR